LLFRVVNPHCIALCQNTQDRNAVAPKVEEFRRKAEEAEAKAAQLHDYEAKQSYLEIARQWRQMAAQADRNRW